MRSDRLSFSNSSSDQVRILTLYEQIEDQIVFELFFPEQLDQDPSLQTKRAATDDDQVLKIITKKLRSCIKLR